MRGPVFMEHKKGRDTRQSVKFEGRSYKHFNRDSFKEELNKLDWPKCYALTDPEHAWAFILEGITNILDQMCPIGSFHVKNYRPNWITNELLEQIKDRDYFYHRAKLTGDEDAWNIDKYFRNVTNANIRKAKREFILEELNANADNCKKFWKVIREVVPSDKIKDRQDILLKDKGVKVVKENVADFINNFFINVGNVTPANVDDLSDDGDPL